MELFFAHAHGESVPFVLQISLWLWFTVIFANFAEAMAEGRGKAQADALRKTRTKSSAEVRCRQQDREDRVGGEPAKGDLFVCEANDRFPPTGKSSRGRQL